MALVVRAVERLLRAAELGGQPDRNAAHRRTGKLSPDWFVEILEQQARAAALQLFKHIALSALMLNCTRSDGIKIKALVSDRYTFSRLRSFTNSPERQ